jgi:putative SOS response-associated peptidase YedK
MCNLYSITTNQEAIRALFRVINRYVGNLPTMPCVFPSYPAPVVRNAGAERELVTMLWGMSKNAMFRSTPWDEAKALQRPLREPDLTIVARGAPTRS